MSLTEVEEEVETEVEETEVEETEVEVAPQTETTLEFAPTEAFPRLDCGGRGFYQVRVVFHHFYTCAIHLSSLIGWKLVLFLHLLQIPFL